MGRQRDRGVVRTDVNALLAKTMTKAEKEQLFEADKYEFQRSQELARNGNVEEADDIRKMLGD